MSVRTTQGGSVGSALSWMNVPSALPFWLATLGPLVAGFVGGRRKAGGVGPAPVAAAVPAGVVHALIFLVGTSSSLPVIGGSVGAGVLVVILVRSAPLPIGALCGGATTADRSV